MGIDPYGLVQLLWREEALEELRARGLARGLAKKARHYVWEALAQGVAAAELRDLVRERVKARPEWNGAGKRATDAEGQQRIR